MSYVGYRPANVPFTADQIKPLGDQLYSRLDKANDELDRFPNALINSSFHWWQRGTSFVNGYNADRWTYGTAGGTNITVAQQAFAFGDIQSESKYFTRAAYTATSSATDYALYAQAIEGVGRFAGKRVVVRGWARRSAGSGNVAIELSQQFGTSGSAEVDTYVGTIPLTTNWQQFSFVVNVPSIAGKIIGTANDNLSLNLWMASGSNYNARTNNLGLQTITVDFADLEVKEVIPGYGDTFPGYERVPREIELLRCYRYYEQGVFNCLGSGYAANCFVSTAQPFMAPKRVTPTMTVLSSDTNANIAASKALGPLSVNQFRAYCQSAGAGNYVEWAGQYTANAEF